MIGGGWEAQAAVGRDGRCKGEAQLAGGSEGRSNAVVHWTEADRLLIDRRKGIKIKLPIDRQLNNNNIGGSSIDQYFIKLGTSRS